MKSRPFTYNNGNQIPGTEKFGNLTVGIPTNGYQSTNLQWWNGPDEDLGYVVAKLNVEENGNGLQPTPIEGVFGNVGFNRTKTWLYSEFLDLVNSEFGQNFTNPVDAKVWLESNSKWTSFVDSTDNTINNFIDRVEYNGGFVESESSLSSSVDEIGKDLFNQSSLVITPNGYEQSLLFSLKPTNGSGDMVVSRSTTATRVNENGLIDQVPYNLFPQSENFNKSRFNYNFNVNLTINLPNSPIGTNTVTKYSPTASNNYLCFSSQVRQFALNDLINISVYSKIGEVSTFDLGGYFGNESATFNLSTGVITPRSANVINYSMENMSNGWFRCNVTYKFTNTISNFYLYAGISRIVTSYNGTDGMFFWGFQVTPGDSIKPYFQTTDRLNVPRIDYTDGVGRLLLEPQRTNLITYSDGDLSTYSSGGNVTNAIPINGFVNSIQFTQDGVTKYAYKNIAFISGLTYTFSCFIEMDDGGVPVTINSTDISSDFAIVMASAVRGVVSIKRLGNTNVYRVSCTYTLTSTNGSFGIARYSTNRNRGFKITGYQLEQGSNATSYIPTTSSTVTRVADVISKTGIGNLIGQTEGTIFIDVDLSTKNTEDRRLFSLIGIGGISNNRLTMSAGDRYAVDFVYNGSFTQIFTNINQPLVAKLCVKYDNFSYKFFVNGVLINTNNSLTPLGLSELYLGSYENAQSLNGFINKFLMFKTSLTDQECINLTAL